MALICVRCAGVKSPVEKQWYQPEKKKAAPSTILLSIGMKRVPAD